MRPVPKDADIPVARILFVEFRLQKNLYRHELDLVVRLPLKKPCPRHGFSNKDFLPPMLMTKSAC